MGRTTESRYLSLLVSNTREIYSPVVSREEWQKSTQNDEFVQQLLTSHELLVDSAEQPRERPLELSRAKEIFLR